MTVPDIAADRTAAGPGITGATATDLLKDRYAAALMPNYGTPPLALTRGEGCVVWDADGNSYLDLLGGIAVSALGHAHPAIVEAIEAALKLIRRIQGAGRPLFVAAEGGFHGRTMGSLSLTGKSSIREPFGPFGVDVRFVPYGDAAALAAAIGPDCAGLFLEPCLGEGGIVPAPVGYLQAARAACDSAGALLVLDEIQSGIGRTGAWFACQSEDVVPDVITLAKGLGGGLPIGACIGIGAAGSALGRGEHGSTFGGNPIACAAALAVLDTIERDGLLENVTRVGAVLSAGITAVDHPWLAGVRGSGLWLAIELTAPVAGLVEAAARQAGFLVNAVQPDAIRLAPPLVLR